MLRRSGNRPPRTQRLRQNHSPQPLRRHGFPHHRRNTHRRRANLETQRRRPDPASPYQNRIRLSVLSTPSLPHSTRERRTSSLALRRKKHRSHRARAPPLGRPGRQSALATLPAFRRTDAARRHRPRPGARPRRPHRRRAHRQPRQLERRRHIEVDPPRRRRTRRGRPDRYPQFRSGGDSGCTRAHGRRTHRKRRADG